MNDPCPVCGNPGGCKTYPLMVQRYLAGRDRDHWRRIHDQLNGIIRTPPPPSYPPLLAQAGNAAAAAGRVVGALLTGQPVAVDAAEQERRLAICAGTDTIPKCEWFDEGPGKCRKCGCFTRFKAMLMSEVCPIGKWGKSP